MSREERRKVYKEGYEQGRFDERMDSIDNRPPTEQEVCEALGEYYGETIIVNPATLELMNIPKFANDINKETHIEVNLNKMILDERYDLITMIGRFYEGKSERK